ncbi:Cation/H+ exchanger [Podospora appendiculata]|uniref:Cation/H+ exchanger n=1 Tax=Podospora appendiculata TaxID=314037 RepID=A0AAE0XA20_9PEZI|nr:Cation/H+ exchanger [Podospora appendiculata]
MAVGGNGDFLEYHEPGIVSVLTLVSFFVVLAVAEWLSAKIFRAGLIGQIIVGLVYGTPIGDILAVEWQETFLALGYIGLILIIFEGGLTIRLGLLRQNLLLSVIAALVGILAPIALSFALLYAGFGHTALEAFILGTSLCSTSLGTTLVILTTTAPKASPTDTKPAAPPSQTRIGTVLISAAVIDDVCGLVLVSVIQNLRDVAAHPGSLGWTIGRPILASGLLAIVTPLVARFVAAPLFRVYRLRRRHSHSPAQAHMVNFGVMVGVLSTLVVGAAYAGASMLFGAFLAGGVVASLRGEDDGATPGFVDTFERYVSATQRFVLQPLFFASIGFAIPFKRLWGGEVIWKGVVYAVLMLLGKVVVGACVLVWDLVAVRRVRGEGRDESVLRLSWAPAALLGSAMVARGEIGLLIIQIGLNETPFLTEKAFVIGVWAIVLNTVVGPVAVGLLIKRMGARIAENPRWGVGLDRCSGRV